MVVLIPYSIRNQSLLDFRHDFHDITEIDLIQIYFDLVSLTPKHRETHGCVVSTVAADALVLKHQSISIHNAD